MKKYFVVNDIIKYISKINIIQANNEENEIITKVLNYLIDSFFDIDLNNNLESI